MQCFYNYMQRNRTESELSEFLTLNASVNLLSEVTDSLSFL